MTSRQIPLHVILLAAGMGSRFGGLQHKSLAPLQYGLGSLPRLLRQLQSLPLSGRLCVVTGHHHAAVSQVVAAQAPGALCVHNPAYATSGVLQSLATALARPELQGGDAWVLFADTVYHPRALAQLLAVPAGTAALATQPWRAQADHPIAVHCAPLSPSGPAFVRCLSAQPQGAELMMAPAVCWPQGLWPAVQELAAGGLHAQWQALQALLEGPSPPALLAYPLAEQDAMDVDTPADLHRIRQHWINATAIHYFRHNLNKDERSLLQPDSAEQGHFIKRCQSPALARHEFEVLRWLQRQPGEPLAPAPHGVDGASLALQRSAGIRLYDLLRLLRGIEQRRGMDSATGRLAVACSARLLAGARQRLQRLQTALHGWPGASAATAYPLDSHVGELLEVLLHLLQLPPLSAALQQELSSMRTIWQDQDARLPFRDATPKNILVAIPALAPRPSVTPEQRLALVEQWLHTPEASDHLPMLDYDFTSTVHLTAPEDDVISLLGHAGSHAVASRLACEAGHARPGDPAAWLAWLGRPAEAGQPAPCGSRAARALLVRYLRFGGRKLAYRIINPTGYATRFRYDDPAFYFTQLPRYLERLDPGFAGAWPRLHGVLEQLATSVAGLPPWQAHEAEQDLFLAGLSHPVRYWQESPLETLEPAP